MTSRIANQNVKIYALKTVSKQGDKSNHLKKRHGLKVVPNILKIQIKEKDAAGPTDSVSSANAGALKPQ